MVERKKLDTNRLRTLLILIIDNHRSYSKQNIFPIPRFHKKINNLLEQPTEFETHDYELVIYSHFSNGHFRDTVNKLTHSTTESNGTIFNAGSANEYCKLNYKNKRVSEIDRTFKLEF